MTGKIISRISLNDIRDKERDYEIIKGTTGTNKTDDRNEFGQRNDSNSRISFGQEKSNRKNVELDEYIREYSNITRDNEQNWRDTENNEIKNSLKDDYVIDNNFAVMTRERILERLRIVVL